MRTGSALLAAVLAWWLWGIAPWSTATHSAEAPGEEIANKPDSGGYSLTGDSPKAHVGFYINAYGLADPKVYPLVERAFKVFESIRSVADKRSQRLPQLKIVNSDGDPWAVSLPDGYVVLSRRAVESCYHGIPLEAGDARMAFVLGHELGHMADDDFWHLQAFMALSGDPQCEGIKKILERSGNLPTAEREQQLAIACAKEMKADDRGFLYAAIAGYRIETLLGEEKGNHDFFTYWMKQVSHAGVDEAHPSPDDRTKFLRSRLAGLLDKIDTFKFGVRLAHFRKYGDAVYFLREFQEVFPSREVLNDLGYCHLQMAVEQTDSADAYRYWLPAVLDVKSRAESYRLMGVRGGSSKLPETVKKDLEMAADYFLKACEMDRGYLPSRINLAVAYFYLGDDAVYKARAAVEEAGKLAPADLEIQGLRALIISREGQGADTWPDAVKILEDLTTQPNRETPACLRFNLAVLLDERGRSGKAQEVWTTLAKDATRLPQPYCDVVSRKTQLVLPCSRPEQSSAKPVWELPVEVGLDILKHKSAGTLFSGWKQLAFNWQKENLAGRIYRDPEGQSVLELDGYVEMVVLAGDRLGTEDELLKRCGKPPVAKSAAGGMLWSYGAEWTALVSEGKVKEIWVAKE